MQALIGGNSALSVSPPLTSDLWALGVLLSFLFLGCSLFDTAHYIDVASDGYAIPTSEITAFDMPIPATQPSLHPSNLSILQSVKGSVISRLVSNVSGLFGKSSRGSAVISDGTGAHAGRSFNRNTESMGVQLGHTNQRATARAAIFDVVSNVTKSKLEGQLLDNRAAELIKDARNKVEITVTIPEIVHTQVELLRAVGASPGACL